MPTKRCEICRKVLQIEENSICCPRCEERELDLLMTVYGFIHCHDSEYVQPTEIMHGLEPVHGLTVTLSFLKSWVKKQWLEPNFFEAVRVPGEIRDVLEEEGFNATAAMRETLVERKNRSPKYEVDKLQGFKERLQAEDDKKKTRIGMVFMEKKKQG